jgi:hypothetical protein
MGPAGSGGGAQLWTVQQFRQAGDTDAQMFRRAAASGEPYVIVPGQGGAYVLDSPFNPANNQHWLFWGATLEAVGSAATLIQPSGTTGWCLDGRWMLQGTMDGTDTGSVGIDVLAGCQDFTIRGVYCRWLKSHGMRFTAQSWVNALVACSTIENTCTIGTEIGTDSATPNATARAEYLRHLGVAWKQASWNQGDTGNTATLIRSGNAAFDACSWLMNHIGIQAVPGVNDSHFLVTGCQLNHHFQACVDLHEIGAGADFVGCHFYQSTPGVGDFTVDGARGGINIRGGRWNTSLTLKRTSRDMGPVRLSGLSVDTMTTGPGPGGVEAIITDNGVAGGNPQRQHVHVSDCWVEDTDTAWSPA